MSLRALSFPRTNDLSRLMMAIAAGSVLSVAAAARATSALGVADNYNVYVLGNDTQGGSDIGALGLAVGGNFQSAGTTIHGNVVVNSNFTNVNNTVDGNIVAGSVNWQNPSAANISAVTSVFLDNGQSSDTSGSVSGIVKYGTTYSGPATFNKQQATTILPFNFATTNSGLISLSNTLQSTPETASSTVNFQYGGLTLNGSGSDTYVFHVTAAQLSGSNSLNIQVSSATPTLIPTVVVDVSGTSASFQNAGISLNGTDVSHVLYNFSNATSLNLGGIGIEGSLLAPNAAVNFSSGDIDGTLIAGSLSGGFEAHSYQFAGTLVPEPASALSALAGGALTLIRRRRNRA